MCYLRMCLRGGGIDNIEAKPFGPLHSKGLQEQGDLETA